MLAAIVHEREPLQAADLPHLAESWLRDLGALTAVALLIWLMAYIVERPNRRNDQPSWLAPTFIGFMLVTGIIYLAYLLTVLPRYAGLVLNLIAILSVVAAFFAQRRLGYSLKELLPNRPILIPLYALLIILASYGVDGLRSLTRNTSPLLATDSEYQRLLLTFGGLFAILTVGIPFVHGMTRLSVRRILALAGLCFKDALRGKVLWVTAVLVPFFLFADWFLPHRPESQLQVYIEAVFLLMTILFLVVASWLGSLSIPADLRQQTIHTVVTKPVERFEIVLGRFLGYLGLMTLWLIPTTALGLLFVLWHGVHPDAAAETMRARVPVYGELHLRGLQQPVEATRARVWDYRRYISGGPDSPERAIWYFGELPGSLLDRDTVPCEFGFDILRYAKGEGVLCTLTFQSRRWSSAVQADYHGERASLQKRGHLTEADIQALLAEKYGFFEVHSKKVLDYHTYVVDVPAGLFRSARGTAAAGEPLIFVTVRCQDRGTHLGVAKFDLYFLDAERSFVVNLFKGAAGLWFRICLVLGLAVALSTWFSGIISFVLTICLYLGGLLSGFIQQVAFKTGGVQGPAESFLRMVNRSGADARLEETPFNLVAQQSDEVFRWLLRFVMKLFPDVERFSLTDYVAHGFDVAPSLLGMQMLLLIGYLLPCAVLAYYLMKNREIGG